MEADCGFTSQAGYSLYRSVCLSVILAARAKQPLRNCAWLAVIFACEWEECAQRIQRGHCDRTLKGSRLAMGFTSLKEATCCDMLYDFLSDLFAEAPPFTKMTLNANTYYDVSQLGGPAFALLNICRPSLSSIYSRQHLEDYTIEIYDSSCLKLSWWKIAKNRLRPSKPILSAECEHE